MSRATPLGELLAARIRAVGPIPFAEFMDACLYHPQHGYYSRRDARRFADYYTSPDVHPVFGRLLARQFSEMWNLFGCPQTFHLVECGAAAGRLARQVLDFSAAVLPDFYSALDYCAVERSAARRAAQQQALARHVNAGHARSCEILPDAIAVGCIFSNELLDALPVHRVVMEAGELREIFVGLDGGRLIDVTASCSRARLPAYFAEQGVTLIEGQQAEAGLAAGDWIEDAGRRLARGFLLTVDYGHEARELYDARHLRGTLLAYSEHRASEDYYRAPGEQDLTAHVNFTALDLAGRRAGLARAGLVSQSQFLLALGCGNEFADLYDPGQDEVARLRARLLLKNLIHPEGMGETFQVFIQRKGIESLRLAGLQPI